MISGKATAEGTRRFAARAGAGKGHFRPFASVLYISSIGLGTYLGPEDDETDRLYESAVDVALGCGVNVFDSAINYRGQKSERAVGRALASAIARGTLARDEVFVSTKGGYLPHDAEDRRPPRSYILETFVQTGIAPRAEIASGGHCIAPGYIRDQIARSLQNLGLGTIDLYYLHNIESQRSVLDEPAFRKRLVAAAEVLEEAAESGSIGCWGLATWDGLRAPASHPEHVSLARTLEIAREISGDRHHFAAVQLPVNLAMPEAIAFPSQDIGQGRVPVLRAAQALGLGVFGSATLLQGRLSGELPEEMAAAFPEAGTAARQAIQFSRSAPGMTTSLVGAAHPEHAREDFGLCAIPPAKPERVMGMFQ